MYFIWSDFNFLRHMSRLNKIDHKEKKLFHFYRSRHSFPILSGDGQTDEVNALCTIKSLCNICFQNLESYAMG
jgi:hypothetical protein